MLFGLLTLFTALAIAGVAAWFSIAGLMIFFGGMPMSVAIMAGTLEVGKLLTASWLYQFWDKTNTLLKTYFTIAVVVLMFITSMGIFGFLSKAHMDQTLSVGDNSLLIERLDKKIEREQVRIKDAETVIGQLDKAVQVLIDYDRIRGPKGSIAVRESQNEERAQLTSVIDDAYLKIDNMSAEKLELDKEQLALEAEVGPIKYIAEFVYGEKADKDLLEKAVKWVIIILIFVFDPLAVLLLIAANMTLLNRKKWIPNEEVSLSTILYNTTQEKKETADINTTTDPSIENTNKQEDSELSKEEKQIIHENLDNPEKIVQEIIKEPKNKGTKVFLNRPAN